MNALGWFTLGFWLCHLLWMVPYLSRASNTGRQP